MIGRRLLAAVRDRFLPPAASVGRDDAPALAARLARRYGGAQAPVLLDAMIRRELPRRLAVVSSFGTQSAVLLDLVARIDPATPVIFLATGKHFRETLDYVETLSRRLGLVDVRPIAPDPLDLADEDAGGRLWRTNPDLCCHIRKVLPLQRALVEFDAWVNGRKRFQGDTRIGIETIEAEGGRIKLNPLAGWSAADIEAAYESRDLPRHPLEREGYASIGCSPCTRSVPSGASHRAGRWSDLEKTECGIHRPATLAATPQPVVAVAHGESVCK